MLTRDDMINIETGIVLAEMLGPRVMPKVNRRADVSLVLRVYDRALGLAVAQRFGFENVRSTVALAAPWFIGAAMGLEVLGTFSVGQSSFMVGAMHVAEGSELDGLQMPEMSTKTRVIAVTREDAPVQLHPRPRSAASSRRHRLPRRPVPGIAGHAAQGVAAPPSRPPATGQQVSVVREVKAG